ncbi:unnamed protein product [Linum trigynum]
MLMRSMSSPLRPKAPWSSNPQQPPLTPCPQQDEPSVPIPRSQRTETVKMASWRLFPTTLPKELGKPTSRSLFIEIFKRLPDTFLWFLLSIVCFALHLWTFHYTSLSRKFHPKGFWIPTAVVLGSVIFIYFWTVSRFRTAEIFRRRYGYIVRTVGFCGGVLISASYLLLGESAFNYCIFLLTLIVIFALAFLALRPSTDFNVVNGLFASLITYTLRLIKSQIACHPNCDHELKSFDLETPYPYIILFATIFTVLSRHYFDSRALEADEEGAERGGDAVNERAPGFGAMCHSYLEYLFLNFVSHVVFFM